MEDVSTIRVRQLGMDDFQFVRDLAARQPNFTIPPLYVLWLLTRIKGDICLVAEDPVTGPVGYLLCVPTEAPPNSLYIWQLATISGIDGDGAANALIAVLKSKTEQLGIRTVFFSCIHDSATFRAIRRYAMSAAGCEPRPAQDLPDFVAPGEREFRIDLK